MLLLLVLLMVPLAGIGIDLYTPSLPAISNYFVTSHALVKLTLATYLLGYGLGQPFFGTLSDSYGRKYPLLIGMILFVLASIGAAFSTSIHMLLTMRLLQGLAVSAPGVISKSIVTDSYEASHIPRIASYMSTFWALGPILAPAIGGYLQHYFGWQAAFYFLTIYGLIIITLILLILKETHHKRIILNVSNVLHNYHEIILHKLFIGCLSGMAITYSLLIVFNTIAPFLIQVVLHFSPITYGHIALLMGIAFFLGAFSNRVLLSKFASDKILFNSIYAMLFVAVLMLLFSLIVKINLWSLIIFVALIFYGGGIVFPNCMGRCMSLFREKAGTANAIMGCLFVVATAIVTALTSMFKSETQIPLAAIFVGLMVCCLVIKIVFIKAK